MENCFFLGNFEALIQTKNTEALFAKAYMIANNWFVAETCGY